MELKVIEAQPIIKTEDYRKALLNQKRLEQDLISIQNEIEALEPSIKKIYSNELLALKPDSLILGLQDDINSFLSEREIGKEKIHQLESQYALIKDMIKSKEVSKHPEAYQFLLEYNIIQANPIKRFFGIKKNFKKITSKDIKHLIPKLDSKYTVLIDQKKSEVNIIKQNIKDLEQVIVYKKLQNSKISTRERLHQTKQEKIKLEKPLKDFIENIIDLDLKLAKESLKGINIIDLLLFIKENLLKLSSPKEKVIILEKNLKELSSGETKTKGIKP